ncbi:MAG: ligase-associated DNA damage response DEXH box helicase [Aggregatilineales bacterium]
MSTVPRGEDNPVLNWVMRQGWTPFEFQREVWEAYWNGESGLIHSPTGSGKTYAAWLAPLIEWTVRHPPPYGGATKRSQTAPLHVLWVTPLRALAADTAEALCAPIEALGLPWSVELRTSDTPSSVRSRQRQRLPSALVTTPESLSLMLSWEDAASYFASLQLVVVDEWHELMASKRGVQVELALARLRGWRPGLRVWGLSATLGNLDVALRVLLGMGDRETGDLPAGRLVRGAFEKVIHIESLIPERIDRFPWAGHLGLKLLPQVIERIETAESALIFTNTRSQTELWYQALLEARPDWAGIIALHHSSLSRELRDWVEDSLRRGALKCVVCTSSLDLGVDFSPVDRVLQIGSPKGVARLLQRAGRSGHQPGAESRVICVPTHALELLEVAAVRSAAEAGHIEARPPVEKPLDVLVQHLVTVGLGGGFTAEALFEEVRSTHAYRHLDAEEWAWALDFVTRGGSALQAYPEYRRLTVADGRYRVEDAHLARLHRMSIGTITGDAMLQVKYLRGGRVGEIEESFIAKLKRGDTFILGGKALTFVTLRDMTVYVRRAKTGKGVVPRWYGGRLPLSSTLSEAIRAQLERARDESALTGQLAPELEAIRPILAVQAAWSAVPARDQFLIERVKTREGYHLFFYPFAGRLVHEGLAALFAYRLSRHLPITFTVAANDYGFELLSPDPPPLEAALAKGLLSPEGLAEDIAHSLNATEMAKRQFREIARVSGLVFERFPGGQKSSRQLQASAGLIYDVLANYEPDNRLLEQAQREVMEQQLEQTRLLAALKRINESRLLLRESKRPTPFAFPLLVDRLRQTVSSETLEDRIEKMALQLEKAASREGAHGRS